MSKRKSLDRATLLAENLQAEKETAQKHRQQYRQFRRKLREDSVRYGQIPETLIPYLRPDKMTAAALRVYLYLLVFANDRGEYYKSIDQIATDLDLDVRSVQRGLQQLQKQRLIWPARFTQKRYSRYFLLPFGPHAAGLSQEANT